MAAPNALTRRNVDVVKLLAVGRRSRSRGKAEIDGGMRVNGCVLVTAAGVRVDSGDDFDPGNFTPSAR